MTWRAAEALAAFLPQRDLADLLADLDAMIGLESAKVRQLVNLIRVASPTSPLPQGRVGQEPSRFPPEGGDDRGAFILGSLSGLFGLLQAGAQVGDGPA